MEPWMVILIIALIGIPAVALLAAAAMGMMISYTAG